MIFEYVVSCLYCCFSTSFLSSTTCNELAAFMTSCLLIIITTFSDILLNTSPNTVGLKPDFLLRVINLHATKLSENAQSLLFDMFVIHNFLMSSAIALRRSDVTVPKHDETIILRHPSASSHDGPEPPFVLIAVSFIRSSSMSSYKIG